MPYRVDYPIMVLAGSKRVADEWLRHLPRALWIYRGSEVSLRGCSLQSPWHLLVHRTFWDRRDAAQMWWSLRYCGIADGVVVPGFWEVEGQCGQILVED